MRTTRAPGAGPMPVATSAAGAVVPMRALRKQFSGLTGVSGAFSGKDKEEELRQNGRSSRPTSRVRAPEA